MRYLLTTLIGGAWGFILTTCGATINTWQFWGLLACLIAMYFVGSFKKGA